MPSRAKPLPVYGKGENVRDWLYRRGPRRGPHSRGGPIGSRPKRYNIGGHNERTNIDVVRAICALVDEMAPDASIGPRESLITFVADRPGHDLRYAIDADEDRATISAGGRRRPSRPVSARRCAGISTNRSWWERVRSGVYRGERLGIVA